jgi:CYTH domain-containing protein
MLEIERKFLVKKERLPALPPGRRLTQAYLHFGPNSNVRVRLDEPANDEGEKRAFLTIKGRGLLGREEYEYQIPFEDAQQLMALHQGAPVQKTRYKLPVENAPNLKWELDIFEGDNAGLIVAEIELPSEDARFSQPDWLGEDVTLDPAYKNSELAQNPYKNWKKD